MGRSRTLFYYFRSFWNPNNNYSKIFDCYVNQKAKMFLNGPNPAPFCPFLIKMRNSKFDFEWKKHGWSEFEPGTARWLAQTNPLSYGGPQSKDVKLGSEPRDVGW